MGIVHGSALEEEGINSVVHMISFAYIHLKWFKQSLFFRINLKTKIFKTLFLQ